MRRPGRIGVLARPSGGFLGLFIGVEAEGVDVPKVVRARGERRGQASLGATTGRRRLVTRILVMSEIVLPLAEIKKRLSAIVDGVEGRHDRVVLTRHGRPAAVMISPDDLESLEETLDLLSDPKAVREIRSAEAAIEAGDVVDAEALRAKYLKR
jgi:antitoxin YefM